MQIIIFERMETNIKNIYAIGDAIEVIDFVIRQSTGYKSISAIKYMNNLDSKKLILDPDTRVVKTEMALNKK